MNLICEVNPSTFKHWTTSSITEVIDPREEERVMY